MPRVTEYQILIRACPACGRRCGGVAPACAAGQTALDPQVLATIRNHYRGAIVLGISKWGLDHYDVLYQLLTTGAWLPLAAEPC